MIATLFEDYWPVFAATSVLVAAVLTALHIILRKEDVRSATGWLGLVWLAPLLGVLLYWVLGVNRIRRRARSLYARHRPYSLPHREHAISCEDLAPLLPADARHLLRLAHLSDQVTRQPLMRGNAVELLANGDQAYPRMLAAIEAASVSIALCTYIFDNDRWGQAFRRALSEAAARGVEVRVLIDAVGARYSFPSILRALRRDGVPVARFMPSLWPWRFRYANLRNHRKILVCDGRQGFTGGMNIRAGNVLGDRPDHPIVDLHFEVRGPVVAELQRAFADDWLFASDEVLAGEAWFPNLDPVGESVCRGISDGPDEDFDKLQSVLMGALASAHREITIVTPYFLPDEPLAAAIRIAALRGVVVRIVLPERSNLRPVQWAAMPGLAPLMDAGCEVYRVPPPFDHSKVVLIDGAWLLFGSANIDARSLVLNFEFNVECYGAEAATAVAAYVATRLRRARRMDHSELSGQVLPIRLRNRLFRLFAPYL